ncbi:MAG: hypothetical protein WDM87_14405 [Terracidiphilus sp.]
MAIPVVALAIFFGALALRAFTGFAFEVDFFRATGFFGADFFVFAGAFFRATGF